jgi:hypothetical protein
MRRASSNYGLIIAENKFIGISLGYDHCAEHEWGIKDLRRICGMPEASKDNMGVKSRSITIVPTIVFKESTKKKKKFAVLYTGYKYQSKEDTEKYVPHDLKDYEDSLIWNEKWNLEHPSREAKDNIITAWSDGDFGVAVMGEKEVGYLKELHEAILNLNFTIAVTSMRNPFGGSSLCLLITDRIPQDVLDMMYSADKEYYDREDYEEKIGMKDIIKKYGNNNGYNKKNYFCACSPKWINYEDAVAREEEKKRHNTKFDIIYWVNYSDDDSNYGYYGVEEIKEWLTGKKKLTEIRKG